MQAGKYTAQSIVLLLMQLVQETSMATEAGQEAMLGQPRNSVGDFPGNYSLPFPPAGAERFNELQINTDKKFDAWRSILATGKFRGSRQSL